MTEPKSSIGLTSEQPLGKNLPPPGDTIVLTEYGYACLIKPNILKALHQSHSTCTLGLSVYNSKFKKIHKRQTLVKF